MSRESRNGEMTAMYISGATFQEVGDAFGVSRQRAAQIVRGRTSYKHRTSLHLQERNRKILEAHESVLAGKTTITQEAESLGIRPHSLYENWRSKGLKLARKETPLHGSRHRYNQGCRCAECREAVKIYQRTLSGREPPKHGTASAYCNYACRCDPCRRAGSEHNRRSRERRKQRESRLLHGVSTS